MIKRLFLTGLLLTTFSAMSAPLSCPDLTQIKRVSGEYAWQSQDGLWEGFFAAPAYGRGESSKVTGFLGARWVQLTNLEEGQGVIECDYQGNMPTEIIRFVATAQAGNPKPKGYAWSCGYAPPFPSPQCECGGLPTQCEVSR